MKNISITLLLLSQHLCISAQIEQVSFGAGYANAVYYSLEDGSTTSIDHSTWDIAFTVGPQDLGILVNEAAVEYLAEVALYLTTSTDFTAVDTSTMQRIYNDERSWSAGAFNHITTPGDPFDFGWGSYDVTTHVVNGSRVFVIKLRDDSYKKLKIESLDGGVYTFRYADLDGNNETTQTVNKADFSGKTLAYFRFATNEVLDLEPGSWDLVFTRYVTPVPDGEHLLDYPVAGVLLNAGVQAAQVSGIDPQTMTYKDYPGPYYDTLTAIGYDWKSFDLTTFQWSVPNDRVYFIQTGNSTIWKVQFLDFEGSATGVTTLEKTFQTSLVSAAAALPPIIPVFQLYPNPATDYVRIELELEERSSLPAAVRIFSATGRTLYRQSLTLNSGSNRIDLPLESLAPGAYYLNVELGAGQIVRPLIISR